MRWPSEISNPPDCTEGTEDTEGYRRDQSHCVSSVHPGWMSSIKNVEDAVRHSLPSRVHQNNSRLFYFARGIKSVEKLQGEFTPDELRDAFNKWHSAAKPFLRPNLSKEDYFMEFLNAYRQAKYPLGGAAIPTAWKLAKDEPLPTEAGQFESRQRQLLVALCWQLQITAGQEPFFLSCRTCQELFEHKSHTTSAMWLQSFCALRIIKEIEKGTNRRASRYVYLSLLDSAEETKKVSEP